MPLELSPVILQVQAMPTTGHLPGPLPKLQILASKIINTPVIPLFSPSGHSPASPSSPLLFSFTYLSPHNPTLSTCTAALTIKGPSDPRFLAPLS